MNKDEKYLKNMKKQGLAKVCVAVPEACREEIMIIAEAMRITHRKKKA